METSIFIIEDDALQVEVFRKALDSTDYRFVVFSDAESCLDRLSIGEHADVLLLDQNLPGMSGLDMVRSLRTREIDCPIIMLSATFTSEFVLDALQCGVYTIIPKPFDPRAVVSKMQRVISHYKSLKLGEELMTEFQHFADCSDLLVQAYQRQLADYQEHLKLIDSSLRSKILKRESEKWLKEMSKARSTINKIKSEYKLLRRFLRQDVK